MPDDASEQKNLPPSKRKLRELRKKGQVSTSKDMVGAVTFVCATGYLLLASGVFVSSIARVTDAWGEHASNTHPEYALLVEPLGAVVLLTTLPVMGLVVSAALLANVAVLRGIPFSLEPIKPDFNRLNPIAGFKRLFGLKAWVELGKSVCKTLLLSMVLVGVLMGSLRGLVSIPACGPGCMTRYFGIVVRDMALCAAGIFLLFGLLDVLLQSWLFKRDQKMGQSETKRERKESEGDPLIRSARRKLAAEARETGAQAAKPPSLIVFDGSDAAVGIRFARGETPVPLVVSRAMGRQVEAMLDRAALQGVSVATDPGLVLLLQSTAPGQYVPTEAYQAVANALRSAGLLG